MFGSVPHACCRITYDRMIAYVDYRLSHLKMNSFLCTALPAKPKDECYRSLLFRSTQFENAFVRIRVANVEGAQEFASNRFLIFSRWWIYRCRLQCLYRSAKIRLLPILSLCYIWGVDMRSICKIKFSELKFVSPVTCTIGEWVMI
jgi:hypothetical protein